MTIPIEHIARYIRSQPPRKPTRDFFREFLASRRLFGAARNPQPWGQVALRDGEIATVSDGELEELTRWQRIQTLKQPANYGELIAELH